MAFHAFPTTMPSDAREQPGDATRANSDPSPVNVIYIAGYGRSGSTLLDIALGQHPSIMGGGEITTLARHVWENDEYCACGLPVQDCPVWKPIVEGWRQDEPVTLLSEYRKAQERTEGVVGFARILKLPHWSRHVRRTANLLRSITQVSGRSIIVDSSKLPGRGFALASMPGVELHVVHLVRDGRGVAWSLSKSYGRQLEKGLQRELRPKPVIYSAIRWATINLATELLCRRVGSRRSIRIRYEDFVADPNATIAQIFAMVGVVPHDLPTDTDDCPLSPGHQVAGSRHRMERSITIRKDEKWMAEMPASKRLVFNLICGPLLRRYGYPSHTGPSS